MANDKQAPESLALTEAVMLHRGGELRRAEIAYRALLDDAQYNAASHHNLGVLLRDQGRISDALPHLKAALDACPSQRKYRLSLVVTWLYHQCPHGALATLSGGRVLGLCGDDVDALEAQAAGQLEQRPSPQACDAIAALLNAGQLDAAEHRARCMVAAWPNYPFGWRVLALAVARQERRFSQALALLARAVERAPLDLSLRKTQASVQQRLGLLEEAMAGLQHVIAFAPGDYHAVAMMGSVHQAAGRLKRAAQAYRASLASHGAQPAVWSNLGIVLQQMGCLADAEQAHRRAVALAPELSEVHCNLGCGLLAAERVTAAVASLRRAIQLNPNNAQAHNNLGNALRELGQFEASDASLRQAVVIAPHYMSARSNRLFSLNYRQHDGHHALALAREYGRVAQSLVAAPFSDWRSEPSPQRLRVGFVSGDLCRRTLLVISWRAYWRLWIAASLSYTPIQPMKPMMP